MRASFCLSCSFVEAPEFYHHHHNSVLRQYLIHTLFRACVGRQLQPFAVKKKKKATEARKEEREQLQVSLHSDFKSSLFCFLTLHIWTCQNPLPRPNSPHILICFPKEGRVYLENKHMCVTGSTWNTEENTLFVCLNSVEESRVQIPPKLGLAWAKLFWSWKETPSHYH